MMATMGLAAGILGIVFAYYITSYRYVKLILCSGITLIALIAPIMYNLNVVSNFNYLIALLPQQLHDSFSNDICDFFLDANHHSPDMIINQLQLSANK